MKFMHYAKTPVPQYTPYYTIVTCEDNSHYIAQVLETGHSIDGKRFREHNYFSSRQSAEEELTRMQRTQQQIQDRKRNLRKRRSV